MKRNTVRRDKNKVAGTVLLLTAACGALAVGVLSEAGSANASCASFNGTFHVGKGCATTDKGDVAIGIGKQTKAEASGGSNIAIAIGNPGPNAYESGGVIPTTVFADGEGNVAFALGNGTLANTAGTKNFGTAIGNGSLSAAVGSAVQNRTLTIGSQNIALALGGSNNTAVVVGRSSTAQVNNPSAGEKNTSAVALGKGKFVNK